MQAKNNKLSLISGVVLFFTAFLLVACSGEVDDKQLVEQAKQYLEQNKLREANLELKNALKSNLNNAEARYLLGQLNITIGDMASAAKEFRKAQEAGWDEAQSQLGLMRALVGSKLFQKVIDEINIKESYPASVNANLYGLKAFSQAALGDIEKAKALVAQGKEIDADAFQILISDIQIRLAGGEVEIARSQLKHALSLYEKNSELLLLSAYSALQKKDSDTAIEQFQKVISAEPKNLVTFNGRSARLGFARLEILNKNFDQAKKLLAPLFKQSPNDPETNYMGGLLSFVQKNYSLAEERLLKVLKLIPNHAKTQLLFGTVNFAQKDFEQAAYYINKYLQQDPENIAARKLLGRTYILMGQHEDAQAILQPGLQGSDDAELLALIGLSQLQGGNIASGISDLEKAVIVAPKSKALRSELAKAYISAGETESAIKQLHKILLEGGNRNQTEVLMVSAYLRAEQYDQAINIALEMLERSPKEPSVLTLVGNVLAASGDRSEARKYFNKARENDPDYTLATMLLAGLEEVDGNYDEAVKLYRSTVGTKTTSINPYLALARLSSKKGDNQAMVDWLEKARELDLSEMRSRLVLAEHYIREKQFDKVSLLVKEVVAIAPADSRVLALQGRALMEQQRYNEALVPLNKLVSKEASASIGHVLLGESYLRLGQLKEARQQLAQALEINEFDLPALVLLSNLEQADGQLDIALMYSRKVQKIKPDSHLGYEIEGDIHSKSKNYNEAKLAFEQAILLQPSSSLAVKLSGVLLDLGKKAEAKKPLLQWLSQHPDDVKAHYYLGSVYQSMGENARAINEFEVVLVSQPENAVALNNLAWLYALEGNPAALKMAEKVYQLSPENPGIQDTYGWILVENGQVDKGRRILEQAMKSLPDVAEVRYHYAVALARSGETIEAKKRLNQLLQSEQSFIGIEDGRLLLKSLQ